MKILVISGSVRTHSINQVLAKAIAQEARKQGHSAHLLSPQEADLPLFHGDLEADPGVVEKVLQFDQLVDGADLILIASPEYNGFMSPYLHNLFTWASRRLGEQSQSVLEGKVIGLSSATPGPAGGIRMLGRLSSFLGEHGCWVNPRYLGIGGFASKIDDSGALADQDIRNKINALITKTAAMVQADHEQIVA